MSIISIIKRNIVEAYRIWLSYDLKLIVHMIWNRIKYKHYHDFLKADWPCKFDFLLRHYNHILEKCKNNPISTANNIGPIWVCWWQGEDKMPEVVRFCYESLKRNTPSEKAIIFLDSKNYREYVDIPEYIIKKFEKRIMSITHFTDILRMTLLAKHGGLWIDSTVFLSDKMPDCVFQNTYFSAKTPFFPNSVAKSKYTVFLLGAAANSPWIVYARDMLYEYWKTSWKLLDYILVNYILTLALDSIPELNEQVKNCILDTPHITTLQRLGNETCNMQIFNKMISECQFYKLSYKLVFKERDENGNLTYYGMMRKKVNESINS